MNEGYIPEGEVATYYSDSLFKKMISGTIGMELGLSHLPHLTPYLISTIS